MIEFISKNNRKNLILFVHGFMGGDQTWLEEGQDKIPQYLEKNPEVSENFDIAYFKYFTMLIDKIEHLKYFFGLIPFGKKRKFKKNLSIDDITDILYSHIQINLKQYDKIIIIGHSMGGLISKAVILKLIKNDQNKVALFLSLAVPHNGSKLADLGNLILNNVNVHDLSPLSKIIDEVNRAWIDNTILTSLPETVYYQGKNDNIVPNESSAGYDARKVTIVYSDDDHFSILKPQSADTIVLKSLTDAILDTLKKKHQPEKLLINAEISDESLQSLTDRIGTKLGIGALGFNDITLAKDLIPGLISHISKRVQTIEGLLEKKKDKTWLALNGMYDTGKTQLAVLIKQNLNIPTIWISFKESGVNFEKKLYSAFEASSLTELESKINLLDDGQLIVLDDLPKFGISDASDNILNSFISFCQNNNLFVLSTSNHKLSASVLSISSDKIFEQQIPLLTREECDEVLSTYPDSSDFDLKEIIYDITEGYPVYLQVICRFLQDRGWKIELEELTMFFSGRLFTNLTDETLSKFVTNVEDPQVRDLLYRFNIIRSDIGEKEIKIISGCNPSIEQPFEKIIPVIGTWLQRDREYFIVSPLFKRLGVGNLSDSLLSEASYLLGKSLLEKKLLSQYDVKNVITYFTDAKKLSNAGFVVLNLLLHCQKNPEYYYDNNLTIYTWYYVTLPEGMPLMIRLLVRSQQLTLALGRESESAKNVDFLQNDLIKLVEKALIEKVDVYFPALTLSSSFLKKDSALAIKYFSYYINSYTYRQLPKIAAEEFEDITKFDNSMVWMLLLNIETKEAIEKWFINVEDLGHGSNNTDGEQAFLLSERLFQNFIAKETLSDSPDWNALLETLHFIFEKAAYQNIEILKALAIKSQIIILSEKLDNISGAEELLLQHENSIMDQRGLFLVRDELGRQLYFKNLKEKSRKYLLQAADYQAEKYVISKLETYSVLAKMAGETNAAEALSYMEDAMLFAQDNIFIDEINYVHFLGEYAIALFLAGQTEKSMDRFIEGYDLLVDTFEQSEPYVNAQLKYGNAIGFLMHVIEYGSEPTGDTFTRPYRGMITRYVDLKDLFFSEKLLIVMFNIVRYYEYIDNSKQAQYWANKIYSLKDKFDLKIFHQMLTSLLGYFIMDGLYDKALQHQVEIVQRTNELLGADVEQIANVYEKEITTSIQSAVSQGAKDKDFDLIVLVLNPIVFHLLTRLMKGEIESGQVVATFKSLLNNFAGAFYNSETLMHLKTIVDGFPTDRAQSQAVMQYINSVTSASFGHLQLLGYLLCSMTMDPKYAQDAHFKMATTFPLYKGCISKNILVPFYLNFWKLKMQDTPKFFANPRKLTENLDKVPGLTPELQLAAIFALIAESTSYKIAADEKTWLNAFYDQFEE